MKVRLTQTLPIDPKHGARAGSEFVVTRVRASNGMHWLRGAAGEDFGAFAHEFDVTETVPAPEKEIEAKPVPAVAAVKPLPKYSDEEKLEKAQEAISYVLDQIRDDEKLMYRFHLTKKMELLCSAYAALCGLPEENVWQYFNREIDEL